MANVISFIGRLAADATVKYTNGGTAVLSFRVGSDVGFGDRKKTNWFSCSVFGKRAESGLNEYLVKGTQVWVSGELELREYEMNGQRRVSADVRVNEVQLIGGREGGGRSSEPKPAKPDVPSADAGGEGFDDGFGDNDIPF